MAALWEEEQKLKEIMERRRMEGSSLQVDAMQRVQELVVSERMLQGKRVKSLKEKKKIPRWSIEKMKEKQMRLWWEDGEERKIGEVWARAKWTCAGNFGEEIGRRSHGQVVGDAKREAFRCRGALEWRRVRKNKNIKIRKCGQDYSFLVQRIQFAAFAKQTGGVNRRRGDEAAAKNDYYERSEKEK